jgi:hypothetical protein
MTAEGSDPTRRASIGIGLLLVIFGGFAFAATALDLHALFSTWPLYVIVPGLILLVVGLVVRQEPGLGLTIAGAIVTTVGFVLLYQESTGHWASWTYAWALVAPTAAGVGMVLSGLVSGRPDWLHDGLRTVLAGLVLFGMFFLFFEGVIGISGEPIPILSGAVLPILFVAIGVLLVGRGLIGRRGAPG